MHHIDLILFDTDLRYWWYGGSSLSHALRTSVRARSLINGRRYIRGQLLEILTNEFVLIG